MAVNVQGASAAPVMEMERSEDIVEVAMTVAGLALVVAVERESGIAAVTAGVLKAMESLGLVMVMSVQVGLAVVVVA